MKLLLFALLLLPAARLYQDGAHKTLAPGSPAPDFRLTGVDGKTYTLASFKDAKVLVVIFTCNHCPTAQAYEDRIIQLTSDYAGKGVAVVAINPNDPKSLRLDELDFSDIGDSFEEMKQRAKEKHFNFPYLYDGETQTAARAYGPIATPHAFIFDRERKLRYVGRIDDTESPFKPPHSPDARNAIDALLEGREVPLKSTKVFGCSIKWSEKRQQVQQFLEAWAKEPVHVDAMDEAGLKDLVHNHSAKLRLIYLWSPASPLSMQQFPDFVTVNRMYRDRDFEFISISADDGGDKNKVLAFLQQQQASNNNYYLTGTNMRNIATGIDPEWKGKLPYTLIAEPGGKIVYAREGRIDPALLKRTIVNNHLIGRYP